MPRMQVDGAELHYEDTGGGGPPVVFSHGLLWSGKMYRFQVEALRGSHRCISFDFRGQGRSPIADSGYDMDTLARDAAALIEKLRAAPCHFVGLSMGGFIGMRLALRRPELLRSLTLIETAADPGRAARLFRQPGLGPQTPRPSQAERPPLRRASRSERIRADVAQLARAAFGPGPHRLEERRDPVDRLEVLRAEAQLEIPPP